MTVLKSALTLALLASTASAAVKLPAVTCPGDARCTFKSDRGAYGTIVEGVPFYLGGFTDRIGSGFIDEARNLLILPFETGGQFDNRGAIMQVGLATGNRMLVSGTIDEMDSRGAGLAYTTDRSIKTQAWDLGNVYVVRPGPAGSVYALLDKLGAARREIIKVDLKTGNRALVWASKLADDATSSSVADSIQNVEAQLGVTSATVNSCERVKTFLTFEVDPKNGDLLLTHPLEPGVTRARPQRVGQQVERGSERRRQRPRLGVQRRAGQHPDRLRNDDHQRPRQHRPVRDEHQHWRAPHPVVPQQFDARACKGKGDVYIGFLGAHAFGKTLFLTTGHTSQQGFAATTVNAAGDRTVIEGKGSLSTGRSSDMSVVAAIPGTDRFIVWYQRALHVFDAATGIGYVLSQ